MNHTLTTHTYYKQCTINTGLINGEDIYLQINQFTVTERPLSKSELQTLIMFAHTHANKLGIHIISLILNNLADVYKQLLQHIN